ncbi:MAG: hypothetical protein FJY76_00910 [Candidatus Aenigmarchaeota archaeon]|nr:hypothetical protein [Candidatus Aenigmarchaeota archaeon]
MQIIVKRPEFEPMFVATIYTRYPGSRVYRVNIGKEATDTGMGNDEMPVGDYVAQSGFLTMDEVEAWVDSQVEALEKDGKQVEFDRNFSYKMCRMLRDIADQSPITI